MRKSVLIVDDEPNIRLLMEATLQDLADAGVAILTACDGQEALEVVAARRPDVVLLDVMMPRVDGHEVCRRVKGDAVLAGTHVVLLTARGQASEKAAGEQTGADQYLTKPFDPEQLLDLVAGLLGVPVP